MTGIIALNVLLAIAAVVAVTAVSRGGHLLAAERTDADAPAPDATGWDEVEEQRAA
jgi:hypothetical protein